MMKIGMSADEFWNLTIDEILVYRRAWRWRQEKRADELKILAYNTALFERQKRLPSLRAILARPRKLSQKDIERERNWILEAKIRND